VTSFSKSSIIDLNQLLLASAEGGKMKKVTLTINGAQRKVDAAPDMVLLDLLREELHLTGTKQSCDRKGQCGACTVIIDGKAVRSCLKKVADLEGAVITTVEGLGTPDKPHPIQEAFVLAGAIQCGYCIPGMIMATKALLDRSPNPSNAEIKKALARNLCRCTGYKKIFEAVNLASRFLSGDTTPEKVRRAFRKGVLGVSHPRPSAITKACGLAEFTADVKLQNAVEVAVVRSIVPHAVIKSIDTSSAAKMPGVIGFVTASDIKGTNRIRVMAPDQPVLCEDKVRTIGDPIIAVVAKTRNQARSAAEAIKVEYQALPVLSSPLQALADGAVPVHNQPTNLCFSQLQIKGDAGKALAGSAAVVEGEFSTQMNHQACLEPETCVAYVEGEGEGEQLVVIGRSINIHGHKAQLQEALGCKTVRYKEAYSGGQFGIKALITSEAIAGAAALHFRRPVRYIPTLHESMLMSSKRHPFFMKVRLGADKKGQLTSYINDFIVDKGAYTVLGSTPVLRSLHMLSGSYNIPNIQSLARLVFTNNAFGGAARGAGPPQVAFALECAMDMLAEKLKIDPLEFRKMNSLKPGQSKSTGTVVKQWPFPELCDAILPHYQRAKKEAASLKGGVVKRGVGVACHSFGIGMAGDKAKVSVELDPDNGLTIYGAVADPGEGNDSMLSQIAAHLLDIPLNKVRLATRDTGVTVGMGPAAGSRMTYMAGGALIIAIDQLKKAMKEAGTKTCEGLKRAGKPTRYEGLRAIEGDGKLDPRTGQGSSFESDVHNVQMAEVEVNTQNGEVRVIKMTAAVDAGTIIHPQNLEGQLEGGMDQGVGYALREEYVHGQTKDWITFKFPTVDTSFEMEIIKRETPRLNGPLGATGIGEMTMVSTAPAVINAIKDACGVRIFNLPATPQKIKAALAKRE
jgi:aldehyde oxidoreductase